MTTINDLTTQSDTAFQQLTDRITAADPAPESTLHRVASAIAACALGAPEPTPHTYRLAQAALDAMKGQAL